MNIKDQLLIPFSPLANKGTSPMVMSAYIDIYDIIRSLYIEAFSSRLSDDLITQTKAQEARMSRRVFFSFHYKPDNWRAAQVRNMGVVEGNRELSDNDWESVKKSGDKTIKAWIDEQLKGRSCTVVLVGEKTAGRKWINYEIEESWNAGKGIVGIHIHNLGDCEGDKSLKGKNPFDQFALEGKRLSTIVKLYDPPYTRNGNVYSYIKGNISNWVEEAIKIRNNNY